MVGDFAPPRRLEGSVRIFYSGVVGSSNAHYFHFYKNKYMFSVAGPYEGRIFYTIPTPS